MHVFSGGLLALALAPSGDPRTIDPAANRPEIVAPGGSPTTATPPKTRSPKAEPEPPTPRVEPEPKTKPRRATRREPAPGTDVTADAPREGCFPERGRCWRLGLAGIVTASVGVAALGTGIGFMQAPQFPVPDEPTINRSLRPPGVAMVAVGAVAVVAGVTLVVAGHASYGRSKRQLARVRLVPGGLRW
jgi:hypothetical protein